MSKRMLIDATHAEETRVAIVTGNRLEDFDYESTVRKQIKSNVYLVKVSRVEPSLQAAFVDFGGNRHGFLPFPEIHPDYYRIPVEDREALLAEQQALIDQEKAAEEAAEKAAEKTDEDAETQPADADAETEEDHDTDAPDIDQDIDDDDDEDDDDSAEEDEDIVEMVGGEDAIIEDEDDSDEDSDDEDEEIQPRKRWVNLKRRYKIQEVIKRNQVMLIQATKEERGNKGAAVTTYISLPGRYCVLMPNSPRGGGVSRKVGSVKDRQRLKKILAELGIPDGMSVIIRTAGISRSKAEIKRDLDYLLRLWNEIREETMQSQAPALIYEEGNLIKRAIRDLYKREIDEIVVAGEDGYKTARDFMKTLMPSHVRRIQLYKDEKIPLFFRYQVENQIDEIQGNEVRLKSGGYIVINPTEALVSVDVNSGKATKARHIEDTALKTNIEAAEEIARQLRLRDLGGLVVIDFIDMENYRNNRKVERKLKDAMSDDRARIQISRISTFGLLEMSRQRLRPSLAESHFETCPHCQGSGAVRTVESMAVMILRLVEEEAMRGKAAEIKASVPTEIALYLLNKKRAMVQDIERRHEIVIVIEDDKTLVKTDYRIEKTKQRENVADDDSEKPENDKPAKRGRRGGRNQKRKTSENDSNRSFIEDITELESDSDDENTETKKPQNKDENPDDPDKPRKRRRRGRRGGRRRNRNRQKQDGDTNNSDGSSENSVANDDANNKPAKKPKAKSEAVVEMPAPNPEPAPKPKPAEKDESARKGWWQRLKD